LKEVSRSQKQTMLKKLESPKSLQMNSMPNREKRGKEAKESQLTEEDEIF